MNQNLIQLLEKLTPEEQEELETFLATPEARSGKKRLLLSDDAPNGELNQLVGNSGRFDWLDAPDVDVDSSKEDHRFGGPTSTMRY